MTTWLWALPMKPIPRAWNPVVSSPVGSVPHLVMQRDPPVRPSWSRVLLVWQ